jgi:hypothetical protein
MRKQIVSAAVFDDEAVSLGVIEPFDLALRHDELPCSVIVGNLSFCWSCYSTVPALIVVARMAPARNTQRRTVTN